MDTITPQEVRKISALAHLALTDDEVSSATRDLSGILNHFSAIGSIDTTDIPPADDASGLSSIAREDAAKPNVLCSSKDLVEGYVQVPGVFN